jgi:PAS domain S-box-containing protein
MREQIATGGLGPYESIGLRRDGTKFPMEIRVREMEYQGRKVRVAAIMDITERKRAEEALMKGAQLLRDTGEMAKVGGWELDLSTKEVSWTEEVGRIHGVEPGYKPKLEEALNFYAPESRPALEVVLKKAAETGEPYDLESLFIPSGSKDKIWVRSLGRAVYSGGKIVKLAGTFQNIDKYKRAEEALQESEQRYRSLFTDAQRQAQELALLDQVRTALARELDLPAVFRTVVEAIANTFGYTQVSLYLLQGDVLVLQHQVGYDHVIAQIPITQGTSGRVARTGEPVLLEDVRADPTFLGAIEGIVSDVCVPLFDQGRVVGTLNVESTDGVKLTEADLRLMTALSEHVSIAIKNARLYDAAQRELAERKQAEETLQKAKEFSESLIASMQDGFSVLDSHSVHIDANPALCQITGFSREELIGAGPPHPYWPPEAYEEVNKAFQKTLRGEFGDVELTFMRKNGERFPVIVSPSWIKDKQGNVIIYFATVKDITERKRAEEMLRESEERYRSLFNGVPVGLYRTTPYGQIMDANPALVQILGYPNRESLLAVKVADGYVDSKERTRWQALMERAGGIRDFVTQWRRYDGTIIWVRDNAQSVCAADGRVLYYEGTAEDITARKQAEEALRESEEKHRTLFETMARGVVYQTASGEITSANPAAERILGLTLDQMQGRTSVDPRWKAMHEDGSEFLGETHPSMVALHTGKEVRNVVMGVFSPQTDEYRWINIHAVPSFRPGEDAPYQVYTTFEDITARKQAEEQLRASLREKEVLLQEIHHRVKNNLQVVSSLLSLQAEQTKDRQTFEAFRGSQNRIRSMALIHEKLYQSPDLARVDFAEYLQSLAAALCRSYGADVRGISLSIQTDKILLGIDTATPCGLLLNELISNALKHAFPAGRAGEIRIEFRVNGDKQCILRVSDNGVGFPQDLEFRTMESLGLQLVNTLVRQLAGSIKLERAGGTSFEITFTAS